MRTEDGAWNTTADGRVVAIWHRTHAWGRRSLDVAGGRAVLPVALPREAPRDQLEFAYLRLDGHRAVATGMPIPYPSSCELVVDCEPLPGSRLVVLEGPGVVPGTELELVLSESPDEWDRSLPTDSAWGGARDRIGSGLSSPIELADQDGTKVYFVRSPRSAWSRVAVDHEFPGERIVFLRPGGRVELQVHARTIHPAVRLRVYPAEGDSSARAEPIAVCTPDVEGRGVLDGLRVGEWEVRAEMGPAGRRAAVLGSERFAVASGATSRVSLSLLDAPSSGDPVRVHGVILVPEPISDPRSELVLECGIPWLGTPAGFKQIPLSAMAPDGRNALALVWDAGLLDPGPWSARIRSVQWCEEWVVEPQRENAFVIDLSQLRRASIRVVDPGSGMPLAVRELELLRTSAPACWSGSHDVRVPPARSTERTEVQVLEGSYRILARGESVAFEGVDVPSLGPPGGLLVLPASVQPHGDVSVSLVSSGIPVPMPLSWWRRIEFRRRSGERVASTKSSVRGTGFASHGGTAVFTLPANGPIELRFPRAEDFEEIAPQEVPLAPGDPATLTVELVPGY